MNRFLCALACIPILCGPVLACPVVARKTVAVAAVAVTPAVVATFAAVPVAVPTYSASYQPQCCQTDPAVVELLRQADRRLAALEGGTTAEATDERRTSRAEAADPGAARFVANCARCHDAAVSTKKGGGLTLCKDGAAVALTCEQALSCVYQIATDQMPKGGELEQEADGPVIVTWLSKSAKKSAAVSGSADRQLAKEEAAAKARLDEALAEQAKLKARLDADYARYKAARATSQKPSQLPPQREIATPNGRLIERNSSPSYEEVDGEKVIRRTFDFKPR